MLGPPSRVVRHLGRRFGGTQPLVAGAPFGRRAGQDDVSLDAALEGADLDQLRKGVDECGDDRVLDADRIVVREERPPGCRIAQKLDRRPGLSREREREQQRWAVQKRAAGVERLPVGNERPRRIGEPRHAPRHDDELLHGDSAPDRSR